MKYSWKHLFLLWHRRLGHVSSPRLLYFIATCLFLSHFRFPHSPAIQDGWWSYPFCKGRWYEIDWIKGWIVRLLDFFNEMGRWSKPLCLRAERKENHPFFPFSFLPGIKTLHLSCFRHFTCHSGTSIFKSTPLFRSIYSLIPYTDGYENMD